MIIPNSDAYAAAKKHLENDQELIKEIGEIQGYGIIPMGSIQKSSGPKGSYGDASLNIIVKGKKKYKDVTLYVVKYIDESNWIVEEVQ